MDESGSERYRHEAMRTTVTAFKSRNNCKNHSGVTRALMPVFEYGGIDGGHHKQWLIDQMLRNILGAEGYRMFVDYYNRIHEPDTWDTGIAP